MLWLMLSRCVVWVMLFLYCVSVLCMVLVLIVFRFLLDVLVCFVCSLCGVLCR